MKNKITHIIGVDEAGRGPLAGPVSVGIAVVPKGFNWEKIPGVNDSKKLSEKKREVIFSLAKQLKRKGEIQYEVTLVGSAIIDRIGISKAVRLGIQRCFLRIGVEPENCDVRLDGLLKAPDKFRKQKTITKGDSKEKVIGLASIVAKVTRDAYMVRIASDHPVYNLDVHKGYGTKMHRLAIKKNGLSTIHRESFCKKLV